jgi:hypothetical protein
VLVKPPTTRSKEVDDIAWLSSKHVPKTALQTCPELLELVRIYNCIHNGEGVNTEFVWTLVKLYAGEGNNIFKIADVEILSHEPTASIDTPV